MSIRTAILYDETISEESRKKVLAGEPITIFIFRLVATPTGIVIFTRQDQPGDFPNETSTIFIEQREVVSTVIALRSRAALLYELDDADVHIISGDSDNIVLAEYDLQTHLEDDGSIIMRILIKAPDLSRMPPTFETAINLCGRHIINEAAKCIGENINGMVQL